jgi:hypothetical protein
MKPETKLDICEKAEAASFFGAIGGLCGFGLFGIGGPVLILCLAPLGAEAPPLPPLPWWLDFHILLYGSAVSVIVTFGSAFLTKWLSGINTELRFRLYGSTYPRRPDRRSIHRGPS